MLGIRLLQIDLHDVFAGYGADVFYRHADEIIGALLCDGKAAVLKFRITLSVPEGKGDLGGITPAVAACLYARRGVGIPAAEHQVFVTGLIIAIPDVYPLLIDDVLVVGGKLFVGSKTCREAFAFLEGIPAEIFVYGGRLYVVYPGIRQMAGRVGVAGKQICHGRRRHVSAQAHP